MATPEPGNDLTRLLNEWGQGDLEALGRLMPLVYDELRRVARARLRHEPTGHTLRSVDLVHEAYLRLVQLGRLKVESRAHFFAVAARLMRQVLVDHARRKRAGKRGGAVTIVALEGADAVAAPAAASIDVLALDAALRDLAALDPRLERVVELRSFAGLTNEESAAALGVSRATVERDWAMARAWLYRRLRA